VVLTVCGVAGFIYWFSGGSNGFHVNTAHHHVVNNIPADPIHHGVVTTDNLPLYFNVKVNKQEALQTAAYTM